MTLTAVPPDTLRAGELGSEMEYANFSFMHHSSKVISQRTFLPLRLSKNLTWKFSEVP